MDYHKEYERWLAYPGLTGEERQELLALQQDPEELERRFFAPMEFGTAGLRSPMGMGIRRMNRFTVRRATQAFARVILAQGPDFAKKGVCVCFDCRFHSDEFARDAARVLAANDIPVRLFARLRPTPELSYAVRHTGAAAGINVTASHNPPEYNGYKVYWDNGAQLGTEQAARVAAEMAGIDVFEGARLCDYEEALADGRITLLGEQLDRDYMDAVLRCRVDKAVIPAAADSFSLAYSPFHGVGGPLMPTVLREAGFKHLHLVQEQMEPDGSFPTLHSPNPEDPAGFARSIPVAEAGNCQLILGTDPDADRLGVMVRDRDGSYKNISANRMGALLLHYIVTRRKELGTLPEKPMAVKTIVTTDLTRAVCDALGVRCEECFTGFKNIAAAADRGAAEGRTCLLGYEESIGYMVGDHARDKDGLAAGLLVGEMACWYHLKGMSLLDAEEQLLETYGFYGEKTANLMMPGMDGLEDMKNLMAGLRAHSPASLQGYPVLAVRDYRTGVRTAADGSQSPMELRGSDVLCFELENGQKAIVRPSGTEPKIKVYALMKGGSRQEAEEKAARFADGARKMLNIE